jgi:hypothetical protein
MLNIISQPNSIVLGRNPINYKVGSSSYLAHIADFKIIAILKLYNLDTGTYSTIATLTGIPNIKNNTTISSTDYYYCTFDIKNVVMTYLKSLNPDIINRERIEFITKFSIQFQEYFNGSVQGTPTSQYTIQATPGGRSVLWMKSTDVLAKSINVASGINRLFITNKRKIINYYFNAPLFFTYYNYDATKTGNRTINLEFLYNNTIYNYSWGTIPNAPDDFAYARFDIELGEIDFEGDVGITGFNLQLLTSFKVQVKNNIGGAFTEALQVVMRNSFPYPVRHFYYRNDHGAIDYLPIFGKRTINNDLTMQSAILNADNSATLGTWGILNAEKINYNELLKEEIEQATGYTSEAEFDLFTEFMLSDARWEMINRAGYLVWVPIQLVDSKFMGKADRQSTWGQKFKFTYGIEEEFCR